MRFGPMIRMPLRKRHHFPRPDTAYITRSDKTTAQGFMATIFLINLLSTTKMEQN